MGTLISSILLIAGVWSLVQYICQFLCDRRRELTAVIGCVVYMEQQYLDKGRSRFTPVYQYEYGGQVYQKVHNDSTLLRAIHHGVLGSAFQVGSMIPLLVDRNDPEYAVVNDYSRYMLLWQSVAFLLIGVCCLG